MGGARMKSYHPQKQTMQCFAANSELIIPHGTASSLEV